ncbi:hypothetical protein [Paraburkholderia fungorum]|uniref:hypothetical protein n=1 Tax=Paraburkholderia fungorum TaxID=134537 RepID=UPI002097344D|nr:hypothetical protein [Paraburkholderia fungorum]
MIATNSSSEAMCIGAMLVIPAVNNERHHYPQEQTMLEIARTGIARLSEPSG